MRAGIAAIGGIVTAVFLIGVPSAAVAQNTGVSEFGAGYQFVGDAELDENFPKGWFVSGGGYLTDRVSIVGEVTGSHKGFTVVDLNLYTYVGGVRLSYQTGEVKPFVQFQAGAARFTTSLEVVGLPNDESRTDFVIQPGGGVDIPLTDRVAARVMVDYRHIFFEREAGKEVRVAAGLVVSFR